MVDGFAERSKIDVTLELAPELKRLPPEYELSLLRVAQECLTNVHRHSGSRTATVRLNGSLGCVELEVSDDGKGLSDDVQVKVQREEEVGVGLRGMRERGQNDRRNSGRPVFAKRRDVDSSRRAAYRATRRRCRSCCRCLIFVVLSRAPKKLSKLTKTLNLFDTMRRYPISWELALSRAQTARRLLSWKLPARLPFPEPPLLVAWQSRVDRFHGANRGEHFPQRI